MELTQEEIKIEEGALKFARANKKSIAKKITDTSQYISEDKPVSVFMAGSPGAGKTEASIELLTGDSIEQLAGTSIERLTQIKATDHKVLRIDPDELRQELPRYTGNNSWLFQKGVSVLVDKIHDLVLKQRQSFLLDGTLSNYEIERYRYYMYIRNQSWHVAL